MQQTDPDSKRCFQPAGVYQYHYGPGVKLFISTRTGATQRNGRLYFHDGHLRSRSRESKPPSSTVRLSNLKHGWIVVVTLRMHTRQVIFRVTGADDVHVQAEDGILQKDGQTDRHLYAHIGAAH